MGSPLIIHDIKEKDTACVQAPAFPSAAAAAQGFPEPKKRSRVSAFKWQRLQSSENQNRGVQSGQPRNGASAAAQSATNGSRGEAAGSAPSLDLESERQRIDKENKARIAAMSPEEVAQTQKELFSSLDPSLLQMLLRRANLDERPSDCASDPFHETARQVDLNTMPHSGEPESTSPVEAAEARGQEEPEPTPPKRTVSFAATVRDSDAGAPAAPNPEPASSVNATSTNTTHFPTPASLPDLDPSDPDFLETLHAKYFPNLPADPSKLAWMAPIPTPDSAADRDSPYYPGQTSLAISQLRFDFRGRILSPRVSRAIPTTKGLHHHGEAPEAAGYTVAELARLARSVVPAQRCIAFQTLGRILFRLGKGEWGTGPGSVGMEIFRSVSDGRVLDSLNEAAGVEEGRGHRGSRAYAIEALWLFERGGWKKELQGR